MTTREKAPAPPTPGIASGVSLDAPSATAPLTVPPAEDEPLAAPSRVRSGQRTAAPVAFENLRDVTREGGPDKGQTQQIQQLLSLRDFLHNPLNIDLRETMLDVSSSRDEIAARLADLKHRVTTIEALATVLKEEIEVLQDLLARREAGEEPVPAPQSEPQTAAEVASGD